MTMRVFMTTDTIGGVWRYSALLAGALATAGMRVCLAVVGPAPSHRQEAEAVALDGVDLVRLDVPLDWQAGSAAALSVGRRRIARAAWTWGADVVQLNQPAYGGSGYPCPVVAAVHSCVASWWRGTRGTEAPEEWFWHREGVREGLCAADIVVAPTHAFAAVVQDVYGLDGLPEVVGNGVPDVAGSTTKGRYVLAAGRAWDESKNFAALDRAAGRIRWPVRLAGDCATPDGEGRADFPSLRCLGRLDAAGMDAELGGASVFVAPSVYEPFGLAVLEAARAGAALVLSDIPTFRELWPEAALFFDPGDPEALAAQVNLLIENPGLRAAMADAARPRAGAYGIARTAAGMRGLYGRAVRDRERMETPA